jgi:hypothetical protein
VLISQGQPQVTNSLLTVRLSANGAFAGTVLQYAARGISSELYLTVNSGVEEIAGKSW